jgi:hypothetical protein
LYGQDRSVEIDPQRHFAAINWCIAKGSQSPRWRWAEAWAGTSGRARFAS